ncbi:MAG: BACON domain-containing protein [Lachnospiraceae bacterium]|nr:BACON domain-containing protein [Lachnospiraceae bacterium]
MAEKLIYISNEPLEENSALEETMINVAEELDAKIMVKNFTSDNDESADAPIIIMCNGVNVQDEVILSNIEKTYFANQHIILYKPTNNEINTVYERLEGRKYFKADSKVIGYSLFGLKMAEDGICYVLEDHEKQADILTKNMVDFLEDKQKLDEQNLQLLMTNASDALTPGSSEVNLATMAKQHIITKSFQLQGKPCSLNYYMVSCHKYDGKTANGGEDWFFIRQYGILNGEPGYDKYWAGTRVKVNGDSWYVGQGEVCLNYVDYYKMKNYIALPDGSDELSAELVYADPQAINGVTRYTVSESVEIGGTIGFEAGGGKSGAEAKGSGSFSAGANFSSSYSFDVQDCTCKGISLSKNNASAEWEYRFKRAAQNRAAGKWQYLHDPAALSYSAFSPHNSWVWKFNTDKRDVYKSFVSEIEIGIMNTISRYSGSQSPKNISGKCGSNEKNNFSFNITFNMPPLLGVDTKSLIFDKEGGTQKLNIAVQGTWSLKIKDTPSWIRADQYSGSGEYTEVFISVDQNSDTKERQTLLQIYRLKDDSSNTTDELIEVKAIQSAGKIS